MITFNDIKKNIDINNYIKEADSTLKEMGYTEHSFAHVTRCVVIVKELLTKLNCSEREIELGQIAAYMHDIGNVVNRIDHAQSGAIMTFRILDKLGMDSSEIARIVTAIGNHDESTAVPVSPLSAALILADKSDVRRSRVRNKNKATFGIHDRVNYAVTKKKVEIDIENKKYSLILDIDTSICSVMEYFEIFMNRMLLCQKAAQYLDITFNLNINGMNII
ncbi:MAG: HD domain-containing protein [Bacilli bacterium]|nr:HD domain-containing protein [Bacillales bacterium]MDY2575447.1 HD domain-containing protein [Bacilli bacterium]